MLLRTPSPPAWAPALWDWLHARSGEEIDAPVSLGSARHPVMAQAPGTYVFD